MFSRLRLTGESNCTYAIISSPSLFGPETPIDVEDGAVHVAFAFAWTAGEFATSLPCESFDVATGGIAATTCLSFTLLALLLILFFEDIFTTAERGEPVDWANQQTVHVLVQPSREQHA